LHSGLYYVTKLLSLVCVASNNISYFPASKMLKFKITY